MSPCVRTGSLLDASTLEEGVASLKALLSEAAAGKGPLIVDLSQARVVDGAVISLLVATARDLGPGRQLAVVVTPALAEAFREWRLDTLWASCVDRASAYTSVGISGGGVDG